MEKGYTAEETPKWACCEKEAKSGASEAVTGPGPEVMWLIFVENFVEKLKKKHHFLFLYHLIIFNIP